MEATINKKNEKENRVKNLVKFSNGDYRCPETAILLPNMHSVLCRAGANFGLTAFISRREADQKNINYCHPHIWRGRFAVYTNREVRDIKGRFVGTYIGASGDKFSENMLTSACNIYLERDRKFFEYASDGEFKEVSWPEVVQARVSVNRPEFFEMAQKLLDIPETILKAALALRERQTFTRKKVAREELISSLEEIDVKDFFIKEDDE